MATLSALRSVARRGLCQSASTVSRVGLCAPTILASAAAATTTTAAATIVPSALQQQKQQVRMFSAARAPGSDPLDILRKESVGRQLCDDEGGRLPGAHWAFSIAIAHSDDKDKAPTLKTVGIQRVSPMGIDFVLKRDHGIAAGLVNGRPISFMMTTGKLLPGEKAEQWRGEGHCEAIPLEDVYHLIPHFTMTSIVGATRAAAKVDQKNVDGSDLMVSKSQYTEIFQKTRMELEKGELAMEELDKCIRAFRLTPDKVECMIGGPDQVMWDRWLWVRDCAGDCPYGSIPWNEPLNLSPH